MGRSAAVLLLTLALGAFVAAHVSGDDKQADWPDDPNDKQCSRWKPLRYITHDCPTCARNPRCITTTCSNKDGKANVYIDLACLFGGQIGFVAVSYNDVCVTNKKGESHIWLYDLECKDLKKNVELSFVVQDKWWFNPKGKELDGGDVCYSKCTHGKPCHTCEFKFKDTHIYIPKCNMDDCKQPKCDEHKPTCPKDINDCFDYKREGNHFKVTFNPDCHKKKMKHVACSYNDYPKGKMTMHHRYTDEDRSFSFNAVCGSEIMWYFEDGTQYRNGDAPICTWKDDDCYKQYFKDDGKVCDQCGRYKFKLPDCKKDDDNKDKPKKGGKDV